MKNLAGKLSISICDKVYIKDPESSELGQRIVTGSIDLIDELGLEEFTFRKLSKEINTTEASIYRYFENKHKLLLYLVTWYWGWMEYRLAFRLANVDSLEERLSRAIRLLTERVKEDSDFSHVNEVKLNRIVITEGNKAFFTRKIDEDNAEGAFSYYKQLIERVSNIVKEISPGYKYPHMLVSTIVEGGHLQHFFADHLPRLSDHVEGEDSVVDFFIGVAFKSIGR